MSYILDSNSNNIIGSDASQLTDVAPPPEVTLPVTISVVLNYSGKDLSPVVNASVPSQTGSNSIFISGTCTLSTYQIVLTINGSKNSTIIWPTSGEWSVSINSLKLGVNTLKFQGVNTFTGEITQAYYSIIYQVPLATDIRYCTVYVMTATGLKPVNFLILDENGNAMPVKAKIGTLSAPANLVGVKSVTSCGNITAVAKDNTAMLGGTGVTVSTGIISPQVNATGLISGVQATGFAGNITPALATVTPLSGVQTQTSIGNISVVTDSLLVVNSVYDGFTYDGNGTGTINPSGTTYHILSNSGYYSCLYRTISGDYDLTFQLTNYDGPMSASSIVGIYPGEVTIPDTLNALEHKRKLYMLKDGSGITVNYYNSNYTNGYYWNNAVWVLGAQYWSSSGLNQVPCTVRVKRIGNIYTVYFGNLNPCTVDQSNFPVDIRSSSDVIVIGDPMTTSKTVFLAGMKFSNPITT